MCVPYCAHAHCRFCHRGAGGPGGHYATAPAASVGRDISPTEGNYGVITATTYVRAPRPGYKNAATYVRARTRRVLLFAHASCQRERACSKQLGSDNYSTAVIC